MSFGALQYALLQGKKTHLQGREDRLISLLNENRAKGVTEPMSEQLKKYALVTHEGNLFHIHNLDGSLFFPTEGVGRDWTLSLKEDCTKPTFSSLVVDKQPVLVMCHTILLDVVRLHIGGSLDEETSILRTYRDALLLLMINLCELVVNGCRRVEDLERSPAAFCWTGIFPRRRFTSRAMNSCRSACWEYFWTTRFVIRRSRARFGPRSISSSPVPSRRVLRRRVTSTSVAGLAHTSTDQLVALITLEI